LKLIQPYILKMFMYKIDSTAALKWRKQKRAWHILI
jgi:hypothetical protein